MNKKPTVTVYQNETDVVIIFSEIDKMLTYRGSSTSFENTWSDGGASGFSEIQGKKELQKFIKENNLVKRGKISLGFYCWSKHTLKDGATLTCELKPNHKSKHQAFYFDGEKSRTIKWSKKN